MNENKINYLPSGTKTEKKNQSRNWKDTQIITKYPNGQHWIKRASLCRSEINLW